MIALVFAALAHQDRAAIAEVEVSGPLRGLVVSAGAGGETRARGELLAGERRTLEVPVPWLGSIARYEPGIRWIVDDPADAPRGSARFLRWREAPRPPQPDLDPTLDEVPPGLRSRPRPPVGPASPDGSAAALLLLAAAFAAGLALRRRAAASVAVSLVGAAAVTAVAWRPPAPRGHVAILEADLQSETWLSVHAVHGRAEIAPFDVLAGRGAVETSPPDARLLWSIPMDGAGAWEAISPRAAIHHLCAVRAGGRTLERAANRLRTLESTWLREEGAWTFRGRWPLGEPIPPATSGPPPPGWLASGLPQGTTVVLGGSEGDWVRATGL